MTGATLRVEVHLARGGIADQYIQYGVRTWWGIPLAAHRRRDTVDVLRDRTGIVLRDSNRRHAAHSLLTVQDDRCDQLARLIVEHQIRSQKVGAALIAASQIDAMACAAVDTIQALPRAMSTGSPGGRCCAGKVARPPPARPPRPCACGAPPCADE